MASPKAKVARARRSVPEDQVIPKGQLLLDQPPAAKTSLTLVQVDTPGKKLLVGVAVGYLALVLVVPTLNVFAQVTAAAIYFTHCCSACSPVQLPMQALLCSCLCIVASFMM